MKWEEKRLLHHLITNGEAQAPCYLRFKWLQVKRYRKPIYLKKSCAIPLFRSCFSVGIRVSNHCPMRVKGGLDNFVSSRLFNVVASLTETRIGKKDDSII